MESVDPLDKWLDPPDEPEWGQCDGCGDRFSSDDLTRAGIPGLYRWLCGDCLEKEGEDNEFE